MHKNRLEAFSDGVLAIIITIMVLELKVPHSDSLRSLVPVLPIAASYLLSFIHVAIYWNNHHHLLHAVHHISGHAMWANMHLLFWLSLVPFTTGWMGEHPTATWPVALYGFVLLMAGTAYYILAKCLKNINGKDSPLSKAIGNDKKGILSVVLYASAIGLAFLNTVISLTLYAVVAIMWFIPDSRIEQKVLEEERR